LRLINKESNVFLGQIYRIVSKSRMTVLAYKSLMVAIPTEALNEKVNLPLVIANNKDFVIGLEALVNFYVEQQQIVTKSEKPAPI